VIYIICVNQNEEVLYFNKHFCSSVANAAIEVLVCVWVPCCCVSVTLSVSAGG